MKRKNILAGILVGAISIALAIGITYVAAFNGSGNQNNATQSARTRTLKPQGSVTGLAEVNDPNVTATPTSRNNCTFPIDIWLQYPGSWGIDSYRLGDRIYNKNEIVDVLRRDTSNPRELLLAQVFVVALNQQNGADATSIRSSFTQSIDWLLTFYPGSTPGQKDRVKAQTLANDLEKFNDGLSGPMPCQYNLSEATPLYLPTLPDFTMTVSPTIRRPVYLDYTKTPRPVQPVKPKPTAQPPTASPVPPTKPPPPPPPPPTNTPLLPTDIPPDTPVPPTEPPPPPPPPPPLPPTEPPQPPQPSDTAAPASL